MNKSRVLIGIVSIVVAVTTILVVSVYALGIESSLTVSTVRTMNLPLAKINGYNVGFRQYYSELESLNAVPDAQGFTQSELRLRVWNRLVEEYMVRTIAHDLEIVTDREDIERYVEQLDSSDDSSIRNIATLYNISESHFKKHILEPIVLRELITQKLMLSTDSEALRIIGSIRAAIEETPDQFDSIILSYGDTGSSPVTTSEVLLTEGELQSLGISENILPLSLGELSPIIGSLDGYYVYRLVNKFSDPEKVWQLAEVYVPEDLFLKTLNNYKEKAKISVYAHRLVQAS